MEIIPSPTNPFIYEGVSWRWYNSNVEQRTKRNPCFVRRARDSVSGIKNVKFLEIISPDTR
jgi:hypothetical protein